MSQVSSHFAPLHFTSLLASLHPLLHYTSLHLIHFTSLLLPHFTSLHFTSLLASLHPLFHYTSLHFTSLHFTSLASLHLCLDLVSLVETAWLGFRRFCPFRFLATFDFLCLIFVSLEIFAPRPSRFTEHHGAQYCS